VALCGAQQPSKGNQHYGVLFLPIELITGSGSIDHGDSDSSILPFKRLSEAEQLIIGLFDGNPMCTAA
jgi:hypothetical protein